MDRILYEYHNRRISNQSRYSMSTDNEYQDGIYRNNKEKHLLPNQRISFDRNLDNNFKNHNKNNIKNNLLSPSPINYKKCKNSNPYSLFSNDNNIYNQLKDRNINNFPKYNDTNVDYFKHTNYNNNNLDNGLSNNC